MDKGLPLLFSLMIIQ